MTFTCVDTGLLLEWSTDEICVENGEGLTQSYESLTLAYRPEDTTAFLEACSELVETVTCSSLDARENTLNIVGVDSYIATFVGEAEANNVVGIPLLSVYNMRNVVLVMKHS